MNQSPHVHCFYQPMKEGIREGEKKPDYSIFDGSHPAFTKHSAEIFFIKEVLGHAYQEECSFELFPNQEAIKYSRPLFLLRDPVGTWSSWKKCKAAGKEGWEGICDLNLFKIAYQHTYDTFINAKPISDQVTCLTREHLLKEPRHVFQLICRRWDIPFTDNMINWSKPFDVNSFSCGEKQRETSNGTQYDHRETFNRIQHQDVKQSMAFYAVENNKDRWQESLVTLEEREEIEASLRPLHDKFAAWSEEYYPLETSLQSA
ncbi:hypothetical protein [Lyngbya aestuarii]|uniref:hypothetical protein n=1 Tax=Lyngbya aestuarii TaxID=118322 RepID=UPI00403D6EAC